VLVDEHLTAVVVIVQDYGIRKLSGESCAQSNSADQVHIDLPSKQVVEELLVVTHGVVSLDLRAERT
jgi:hypothetical protein